MSCFYVILYNLPLKYFLTVSIFLVWRLRVACFEPGHRGFSESAWKDRVESLEDNNNNKLLIKCTASSTLLLWAAWLNCWWRQYLMFVLWSPWLTLLSQLSLPESDDCLMNDWQRGDKTNLSENGSGSQCLRGVYRGVAARRPGKHLRQSPGMTY